MFQIVEVVPFPPQINTRYSRTKHARLGISDHAMDCQLGNPLGIRDSLLYILYISFPYHNYICAHID